MTPEITAPNHPIARAVLSVIADMIMQAFGFFVPGSPSMQKDRPFAFALIYRSLFGIIGSWIAARMAPAHPMRLALIVGGIGLVAGFAGAVTMTGKEYGPEWYPWALVIATMPCAWAGGLFARPA